MGAYRECRAANLRHISLAETFDERVEAVRAAVSAGNFAALHRTLARVMCTKPGQQNGVLSARPLLLTLIL